MKESELRIGNLVYFKSEDDDFAIELKFDFENGWNMNYIKPIPLTEEWLLKFGFVFGIELQDFVKGKHQFIELNCLCGYFSENDIFYYAEKTKLKYVHQLQNLYFALTGEELTTK